MVLVPVGMATSTLPLFPCFRAVDCYHIAADENHGSGGRGIARARCRCTRWDWQGLPTKSLRPHVHVGEPQLQPCAVRGGIQQNHIGALLAKCHLDFFRFLAGKACILCHSLGPPGRCRSRPAGRPARCPLSGWAWRQLFCKVTSAVVAAPLLSRAVSSVVSSPVRA